MKKNKMNTDNITEVTERNKNIEDTMIDIVGWLKNECYKKYIRR